MGDYDFSKIFEPLEFQDFARDMIQVRENIFIESFSEGRDLGIDGRCVQKDGNVIIFQAKRLVDGNRSILSMARKEKYKVDQLVALGINVKRYILALSGDISPPNKDEVFKIFSPYIIAPEDIITGKDLNNYLDDPEGKYKIVEEKYFKLWIQNTKTLKRILYEIVNTPLVKRSEIQLNEAIEKAQFFVEVEMYKEALKRLKKNRVLIISGEPGAGKTTLANQIALYYLAKYQFQAYVYATKVDDLYTAQNIDGKAVIIFDDFWGSNGFDFFGNGMNVKDLISYIEYVQKTNDRILIMATREYILEQGLKKNEDFRRLVKNNKLDCHIEQYSKVDKLRIYFGLLRNSNMTWKQMNSLTIEGNRIIESSNYNPRVISDFINTIIPQTEPNDCVQSLYHYLDCPIDFWKKIFAELSYEAQILYLIMVIMPLPVEIGTLKGCYYGVLKTSGKLLEWKGFYETITELERTVIRTDMYNQNAAQIIVVTYQNPSAKDFILGLIKENFEKYNDILHQSCNYFSQCVEYLKILREIPGTSNLYGEVIEKAAELTDFKSISFFDTHKNTLRYNRELSKFYSRYRTESDYIEIGFGRYMQLLLLYDKDKCSKLRYLVEEIFLMIVSDINRYPEAVLSEDLSIFPGVVVNMVEQRICNKPEEILEIYMNSLMQNRMELDCGDFKRFNRLWEIYKIQNKEKIGLYLNKFYQAELCSAAVEGDADEFYYWFDRCEEDFQEYGIDIPEKLNVKIQQYDSWLENIEVEDIDNEELEDTDYRERNIQEIQKYFKEDYIETILIKEVDDVGSWLQINSIPENIQSVIRDIEDKWNEYWIGLIYDEDSLEFLIKFISKVGYLNEEALDAARDVSFYMETECNLSKGQLLRFLMNFDSSDEEESIHSRLELEGLYPEICSWGEEVFSRMVEAKVLINGYHWYRISNWNILFSIYIDYIYMMTQEEMDEYYRGVFRANKEKQGTQRCEFSILDTLIDLGISWSKRVDTARMFISVLNQINSPNLKRYALIPMASNLYNQLYEDIEEEIITKLIDEIELEFTLGRSGDNIGGTVSVNYYFFVLESISDFSIMNVIPEFTDSQIEMLKESGLLYGDYSKITLTQLNEKNLLSCLGIYDELVSIWKGISTLKMEGENNGY